MRICFIAPANNYHTIKWCNWFSLRGHEVHVISFTEGDIDKVTVHFVQSGAGVEDSYLKKLKYLVQCHRIRTIVKDINPDIVNVHYATSYGTTVALSGLSGYALSVWGADIYDFPQNGFLYRQMLKFSLKRPYVLLSTSHAMANEASNYTKRKFIITPFGVDLSLFHPDKRKRDFFDHKMIKEKKEFVIGTIKRLTYKYGIDYLLKSVALIRDRNPEISISLRIAGEGPQKEEFMQLAQRLGINDIVHWLGFISQEQAAVEWANMDLAVIPSISDSESFGVSAVEAEACSLPVIISDVPGLMEATKPGFSSVIVKRKDAHALADAIVDLYYDPDRRKVMGINGRAFVRDHYELNSCFRRIENVFRKISQKGNRK